jgi:hypothetical protein
MELTHDDLQQRRREQFAVAVDLLGGNAAAAEALDISERTVRRLLAGDSELHEGFTNDIAAALECHAITCQVTARNIVRVD